MKKSLLLPAIAILGMGAAYFVPATAEAQAVRHAPLTQSVLADAAQGNKAKVLEVQRRRIRRGRGFRRGVRRGRRGRRNRRIGAGIAGAIIGGAIIANEIDRRNRRVSRGDAHVNWCYRRYRSYREWDNSYQPYSGPRRECISPYY